ncbi:MAG: hypothetical protein HYS51_01625 [Candidatus Zambryskibacteria bacterium]|nr:hypothetical protein [Candidatus Zambryskibacteria bacterium]
MEQDTDKLIKEQFKTLPQNLRRAIEAVPWKTLVQQIGKENGLDSEQIESLERETMFIIYAFEPVEDYVTNIIREVNISEEAAGTIAQSVGEKILDYISKQAEEFEKENTKPAVPEIKPDIHPMTRLPAPEAAGNGGQVEPGEAAHDVPHQQPTISDRQHATNSTPKVSVPDYRYPHGKDPYREPI